MDKYQTCILTLSDGEIIYFTGKAVLLEGDTRRVTNVKFTTPLQLPKDCTFEQMDKIREEIDMQNNY